MSIFEIRKMLTFVSLHSNINIAVIKMNNKINSVQNWISIKEIFDNGIIKLKDELYIKLIRVMPINYNLKTDFEKEQILNSYKVFLKTCNFDIQILIQSKKEDLSQNIVNIQEKLKNENKKIINIGNNYINYIKKINKENFSSSKNFYILINNSNSNLKNINNQEIIFTELNEKYIKIKDTLSRCGNSIININSKEETIKILESFINKRIFNNKL